MGFFSGMSSVVAPARVRTESGDPFAGLYGAYMPPEWYGSLSAAGISVTPELAMSLSAVYCAVTTISDDIATMPCHVLRYINDEGDKDRARNHPLAYLLRWQPNTWQTAKEFWTTIIGHYLLRNYAIAEIVPGVRGAVDQLIPRHPDRVRQARLPNGRIRYRLLGSYERNGDPRFLTQDEAFVLRDLSFDGLQGLSRITYGANALGSAIAQERFTGAFYRKGITGSLVATLKGAELDDEEEKRWHERITRYVGGAENAGGILFIDEDIDIKALGVEPEKAQLLGLKDFSVREVARLFKVPGHKLEAAQQTQAYAAREAANLEYLMGCLRPIIVGIEQAIQRDLIVAKETYFAEFLMEALLRGDLKARAQYYEAAIQNRWMWPSEVRRREGMNADPELDRLSMLDHRTGSARDGARGGRGNEARQVDEAQVGAGRTAAAGVRATLLVYEAAQRVVRRELAEVGKLAKKHANDGAGWQRDLRAFYREHGAFVAQTMRLPAPIAQAYAEQHRSLLEAQGVGVAEDWERLESEELAAMALEPEAMAA